MENSNFLSRAMININDEMSSNHGEISHKLTSILAALEELNVTNSSATAFTRIFNNEVPQIINILENIESITDTIQSTLPSVIADYKQLTKLVGELSILKEVLGDEYKIENMKESLAELKYEHKQKQTTLSEDVARLRNK